MGGWPGNSQYESGCGEPAYPRLRIRVSTVCPIHGSAWFLHDMSEYAGKCIDMQLGGVRLSADQGVAVLGALRRLAP